MSTNGGPAFPQADPVQNEFHPKFGRDRGMTLRDYFAAKAMQAILGVLHSGIQFDDIQGAAEDAYAVADAMLKARAA